MKIALCLSGYVGAMEKFHEGEKLLIDINEGYSYIKKNIIQNYDVDTFLFSFDKDRRNEMISTYNPIRYRIPKQKRLFKINHKHYGNELHPDNDKAARNWYISKIIFATQSQFYSRQKVIELKSNYEKQKGFKYDWVVIARMDMGYFKPFVFEGKDQSKLYLPGPLGKSKSGKVFDRVNDIFMFGGSEVMDKVGDFYDDIENSGFIEPLPGQDEALHCHISLANYFKKCGLWDKMEMYQNRPWGDPVWTPGDIGLLRLKPNVKTILNTETS